MPPRPPIVGFPCDYRMVGKHPFHMVGEKYILAVRDGADTIPLLIPVLDPPISTHDILANVHGLLFTGALSNVAPKRYGGAAPRDGVLQDEHRDATTLPLLEAAIEKGMPILGLCRGRCLGHGAVPVLDVEHPYEKRADVASTPDLIAEHPVGDRKSVV